MKIYNLFLLFFLLFTLSCTKNESANEEVMEKEEVIEEPKISTFLTVKTGCNLSSGNLGNWIILNDENGNIIDFKPYQLDEILIFEALENVQPNKLTMTTLSVNEFMGNIWHQLNSIAEINKGESLDFSCPIEENVSNTILGTFNLTVNNVPDNPVIKGINASNGQSNTFAYSQSTSQGLTIYVSDLNIYEKKTDYIISIQDGNEDAKYFVLTEYNIDDVFTINYEDFSSYDSYLNIDYPIHSSLRLLMAGFNTDQDEVYNLNEAFSLGGLQGRLRVGQLSRFDSHKILFSISPNSEYEYEFQKSGELPDEIIIPEQPEISIENPSINNFSFNTSISNYINKKSSWVYSSGDGSTTTWDIQSSKDYSPIIGDLPEELLIEYPNLNIGELLYSKTKFNINSEEAILLLSTN